MPHSVENKPAELVRIVTPQAYCTFQRRFDGRIIGLVKNIPIALIRRSIATIVPVEHGIHQAADGAHDGTAPYFKPIIWGKPHGSNMLGMTSISAPA